MYLKISKKSRNGRFDFKVCTKCTVDGVVFSSKSSVHTQVTFLRRLILLIRVSDGPLHEITDATGEYDPWNVGDIKIAVYLSLKIKTKIFLDYLTIQKYFSQVFSD